jgi:hypothetical protein
LGPTPGVLGVLGALAWLGVRALWLDGMMLGFGLTTVYSTSQAVGMLAVVALTLDGLDKSPRVTGVKVPHKVPDFMFITPA